MFVVLEYPSRVQGDRRESSRCGWLVNDKPRFSFGEESRQRCHQGAMFEALTDSPSHHWLILFGLKFALASLQMTVLMQSAPRSTRVIWRSALQSLIELILTLLNG